MSFLPSSRNPKKGLLRPEGTPHHQPGYLLRFLLPSSSLTSPSKMTFCSGFLLLSQFPQ